MLEKKNERDELICGHNLRKSHKNSLHINSYDQGIRLTNAENGWELLFHIYLLTFYLSWHGPFRPRPRAFSNSLMFMFLSNIDLCFYSKHDSNALLSQDTRLSRSDQRTRTYTHEIKLEQWALLFYQNNLWVDSMMTSY